MAGQFGLRGCEKSFQDPDFDLAVCGWKSPGETIEVPGEPVISISVHTVGGHTTLCPTCKIPSGQIAGGLFLTFNCSERQN